MRFHRVLGAQFWEQHSDQRNMAFLSPPQMGNWRNRMTLLQVAEQGKTPVIEILWNLCGKGTAVTVLFACHAAGREEKIVCGRINRLQRMDLFHLGRSSWQIFFWRHESKWPGCLYLLSVFHVKYNQGCNRKTNGKQACWSALLL